MKDEKKYERDHELELMNDYLKQLLDDHVDESFDIQKDQTGFNRRSVPAFEYLKKCQGEMARYLDAAEVYCEKRDCLKGECNFWVAGECSLSKLRALLPYF